MSCDHCAKSVTEEVERIPTVTAVTVHLDTDTIEVTSTTPLNPETVRAAVDEAGYELQ
ncbi:heavy-metal-associated domain-containing protein [Nocardia crassostreae]|uniref:heavy-metal-associated domain-containing protein n=1 Tax=Nocardia crassostreae TaxID=53428 RepID=UPI000A038F03|nr:heavy-metal-associated domain-containing protein [Nocardia crassostreae]